MPGPSLISCVAEAIRLHIHIGSSTLKGSYGSAAKSVNHTWTLTVTGSVAGVAIPIELADT